MLESNTGWEVFEAVEFGSSLEYFKICVISPLVLSMLEYISLSTKSCWGR